MLRPWILTLAALTLFAGSGTAQIVTIQGRLMVPDPGSTPCTAGVNPLRLEHTDVYVVSSTMSMVPFAEKWVQITGTPVTGLCNLIDASAIVEASFILTACGGGALGCPARITTTSPGGGGQLGLFVSVNPGFFPISSVSGTFLLDPQTSILLASGFEPITGFQQFDLVIPANPALSAVTVRAQALRNPASAPGVLQASTVDTIFTGTFFSSCSPVDC